MNRNRWKYAALILILAAIVSPGCKKRIKGLGPIGGVISKQSEEAAAIAKWNTEELEIANEEFTPEELADDSLLITGVIECPAYGSGGYAITLTNGKKGAPALAVGVFKDTDKFRFKAPKVLADKEVMVNGLFDVDGSGFASPPGGKDLLLIPDHPVRKVDSKGLFGVIMNCYTMDYGQPPSKPIHAKMGKVMLKGQLVDYEDVPTDEKKHEPISKEDIDMDKLDEYDIKELEPPIRGIPYTSPQSQSVDENFKAEALPPVIQTQDEEGNEEGSVDDAKQAPAEEAGGESQEGAEEGSAAPEEGGAAEE